MSAKAKTKGPRLQKVALAKRLGVSRPTLDVYLNQAGAPKQGRDRAYDVEAVLKWIEAHAREVGADAKGKGGPTYNEARTQKMMLEVENLRSEMERKRGDFIAKKEAEATIVPLMAELDALMKQKFELELPSQYVGKTAVECAELNAAARDAINARFRQGVRRVIA